MDFDALLSLSTPQVRKVVPQFLAGYFSDAHAGLIEATRAGAEQVLQDASDEAIARANSTPWGLVSYLFTNDSSTIFKAGEALESGTVCVNHGSVNTAYGPYEGWGDSGYGLELSRKAIFEYLKTKHIKLALP